MLGQACRACNWVSVKRVQNPTLTTTSHINKKPKQIYKSFGISGNDDLSHCFMEKISHAQQQHTKGRKEKQKNLRF